MMLRPPIPRRKFLKQSAKAVTTLLGAPLILRSQTLGDARKVAANSRIGIGFVGAGLICEHHLKSFAGMKELQAVAVCDVRQSRIEDAKNLLSEKGVSSVAATTYYEELIQNPDVDIVCVATPDHRHAAIAIEAMKEGKDVFVENPMTLTIEEGSSACGGRKYGRILQVGSQQRSSALLHCRQPRAMD